MLLVNRQVVLKSRPAGAPTTADFDIVETPLPAPGDGEILWRRPRSSGYSRAGISANSS